MKPCDLKSKMIIILCWFRSYVKFLSIFIIIIIAIGFKAFKENIEIWVKQKFSSAYGPD